MSIKTILPVLLLVLLLANTATAAKLYGKIYDMDLNELNDVIVEVDSEPNQRFVSKNGSYSFVLDPGSYVVTANYSKGCYDGCITTENITISKEGDFVFDLFLFPGLDPEDELLLKDADIIDVSEEVITDKDGSTNTLFVIFVVIGIIILVVLYFIVGMFKKREQEEELEIADKMEKQARKLEHEAGVHRKKKTVHKQTHDSLEPDLKKLVDIIKKEGGRTTQKELRKEFPLSEAKISLMISELEHKKIVHKVKKGRGNIIILNKK